MSMTLTAKDLLRLCARFNLSAHDVLSTLAGEGSAAEVREAPARAVVPVSVIFATKKTAAFAAEHPEIEMSEIMASGHGGKVTLKDLKQSLKGKKAKKAKRDPNLPKRALNAYMIYLAARRAPFATSHPDLNGKQVTSEIAKEWRELEDKSEWNAKAAEEKARYVKAMAAYKTGEKPVEEPAKEVAEKPAKEVAEKSTAKEVTEKSTAKEDKKVKARAAKAAKLQLKVDALVKECLSYVELNKMPKEAAAALRTAVEEADEHDSTYLLNGVTIGELKRLLKEQKKIHRALSKPAKKKAAKKVVKKTKIPSELKTAVHARLVKEHGEKWMESKNKEALKAAAIDFVRAEKEKAAEAARRATEVSFSDVESDSDDELEEDEAQEFEYKGKTYWRTDEGFVMEEEDGCFIGRWEDGAIEFDE